MSGSGILDVVLIIILISFFVSGYRSGLLGSLSALIGLVAGSIAAYFIVPLVTLWIPAPEWRTPAALAAAVVLVIGGLSIGQRVGYVLRRHTQKSKLRVIDRALGAVVATVASALVLLMLSTSVAVLGVPWLSPAIASSNVLRTINTLTPTPVQSFLAQLRTTVVDDGLPKIAEAFTGEVPPIPDINLGTPELNAAAQSVVRITGNAYACGQNQSGSGFVVSHDRIITNAHVVAGVSEPVVESPAGQAIQGTVVYFDPEDDLAVIAVDGLDASPLDLTSNLSVGSPAVASGYPFGGPFTASAAQVINVSQLLVADIYGQDPSLRQVYTLAADVNHGDSGGPLLSKAGKVAGVIFATSTETDNVGYALAMDEVQPVATAAPSLSASVTTGACVSG